MNEQVIERCAAAAAKAVWPDFSWDDLAEPWKKFFRKAAAAAIEESCTATIEEAHKVIDAGKPGAPYAQVVDEVREAAGLPAEGGSK